MLHWMAFKYCPKYANSFNLQKNLNTYKDSKELCDKLFFMIWKLTPMWPNLFQQTHCAPATTEHPRCHSKANPNETIQCNCSATTPKYFEAPNNINYLTSV